MPKFKTKDVTPIIVYVFGPHSLRGCFPFDPKTPDAKVVK